MLRGPRAHVLTAALAVTGCGDDTQWGANDGATDASVAVDSMVLDAAGEPEARFADTSDGEGGEADATLDSSADALDSTVADASGAGDAGASDAGNVFHVAVGPNGVLEFQPAQVTIHAGDTVQWTWMSGSHNVVSGTNCTADGVFCSPDDTKCNIAPVENVGFQYSHTFAQPGTFPYFCFPHCAGGMKGTIVVQ